MDGENVAYIHNGVLFSHKKEWNHDVCRKQVEVDVKMPDSKRGAARLSSHMWNAEEQRHVQKGGHQEEERDQKERRGR
jgi:hypothetical protein